MHQGTHITSNEKNKKTKTTHTHTQSLEHLSETERSDLTLILNHKLMRNEVPTYSDLFMVRQVFYCVAIYKIGLQGRISIFESVLTCG